MSDPLDVTGGWDGVFNYPHGRPPTGFRAELREHGGAIAGETMEERDDGAAETLLALIEGQRNGTSLIFAKRYDALDRADYVVRYAGDLNEDGTEVTGRWDIPGIWSGTFLMVRRQRPAAAVEQEASETVR